jgi:hypothetical protein
MIFCKEKKYVFVDFRKFKSAKELGYKSQLNKIQNCKSQKDIVSANRKYIDL